MNKEFYKKKRKKEKRQKKKRKKNQQPTFVPLFWNFSCSIINIEVSLFQKTYFVN